MNTPSRPHPLLGLLISLFPAHFRERYGRDIAEAAVQQRTDSRYGGSFGHARYWLEISTDLLISAGRQWVWSFTRRWAPSPPMLAVGSGGHGSTTPLSSGGPMDSEPLGTANDRFKQRAHNSVWLGLIVATIAHVGLLALFPEFRTENVWAATRDAVIDVLPPHVPLPDPPTDVARPATPRVAVDALDTEMPFASLSDMWEQTPELPPPPTSSGEPTAENAVWLGPSMTRPHLKNGDQIDRMLVSEYPVILRDSGIGGTTTLVLLVDTSGRVAEAKVERSSGYSALDGAAVTVALAMEFTPALNRDKAQAVWVRIPISFQVRDQLSQ